jgi:hypothetical protein
MITIENAKTKGYKEDRPVISLTHQFSKEQLLQLAVAAISAYGLSEVIDAAGCSEEYVRNLIKSKKQIREISVMSLREGYYSVDAVLPDGPVNVATIFGDEAETLRVAEDAAKQRNSNIRVMKLVADVTMQLLPSASAIYTPVTRRYR